MKKNQLTNLIDINNDTRRYFYSQADKSWLDWLWENGFLDVIKKKVKDPTRYSYNTPEIQYLVRMAKENPQKVTDIICNISISPETLNPEVIENFWYICEHHLSADQLVKVIPKILEEKWIPLMDPFNYLFSPYSKIFKRLDESQNYDHILILAKAILELRIEKKIKSLFMANRYSNYFYLDFEDLKEAQVFNHLVNINDKYLENALELVSNTLNEVVRFSGNKKRTKYLDIDEPIFYFLADFFNLKPEQKERHSVNDDIYELTAVLLELFKRIIKKYQENPKKILEIYIQHIDVLPKSIGTWRLRWFVLSLKPEIFKNELEIAFSWPFRYKDYYSIVSQTDYLKALEKGFKVLNSTTKEKYAEQTIRRFNNLSKMRNNSLESKREWERESLKWEGEWEREWGSLEWDWEREWEDEWEREWEKEEENEWKKELLESEWENESLEWEVKSKWERELENGRELLRRVNKSLEWERELLKSGRELLKRGNESLEWERESLEWERGNKSLEQEWERGFSNKRSQQMLEGGRELIKRSRQLLEGGRELINKREEEQKERIFLRIESKILSTIQPHLDENYELREKVQEAGFSLDPNLVIESRYKIESGVVESRGLLTAEEFNKLPISRITELFSSDWRPDQLENKYKYDHFLNPRNAEGVGRSLKDDVPKRLQEYVSNAPSFMAWEEIDPYYTYSFLQGIQKTIESNPELRLKTDWSEFFNFCVQAKKQGQQLFSRNKNERDSFVSYLINWDAVYSTLADVLKDLLLEKDSSPTIDFTKYRIQIFETISYLLQYPDPDHEDEKNPDWNPFTTAINSARGSAYRALVLFLLQDHKKLEKENRAPIADDVKELYEDLLNKENTRALMFMFGHYLPQFYFRDKKWTHKILPKIFSEDSTKKHLYTAAWEGYLCTNSYEEMFFDPKIQKLYKRGLSLKSIDYPEQQHFQEPDERIGIHFALAFIQSKEFNPKHDLFLQFWKSGNSEQHVSFIRFLGRSFVSSNDEDVDELLMKKPEIGVRLRNFWEWILKNYREQDSKPFIEFGYWVNLEKEVFKPTWLAKQLRGTLEMTDGIIVWQNSHKQSFLQLASEAPEDTFHIIRLFLLKGYVRRKEPRRHLVMDDVWFEIFKILYESSPTKSETEDLINDLTREGGQQFWPLRNVILNDS